jgi:hypothetical protein
MEGEMQQLALSEHERELLQQVLDHELRDIRFEIADTDQSRFKDQLRQRQVELRALLDRVGGPLPDRP